jgi:hypothetical protein
MFEEESKNTLYIKQAAPCHQTSKELTTVTPSLV